MNGAGDDIGIYLKEIAKYPLLDDEEEKRLVRRIAQGDPEARDAMIKHNLRLVVSIAKNYVNQGMPLTDLIEEGNIGLLRAVERFDLKEGCKFATYASWWIKQCIRRSLLNKVKNVRIPIYMRNMVIKWRKASMDLSQKLKRPVTTEEIAGKLKLSKPQVRGIERALNALSSALPRDGGGATQTEEIADKTTLSEPEEPTQDRTIQIDALLASLEPREAEILKCRYGLDGTDPLTLKAVGGQLNLTRERVRQIERRALRKLLSKLSGKRAPKS